VKAATRLFSEKGYDATSTSQIAKCAGMSAGVFYRYFKDRRDIFQGIHSEHSFAGAQAFIAELDPEKWRNADMRAVVNSLIDTAYRNHQANPRLQDEFAHIELRDSEFLKERNRIHSLIQERLKDLLQAHRDELRVTNPRIAAYVIEEAVESCIHRSFRSDTPFDEEEFKRELAKMVYNYLVHSDD
jgi:AcrR family transcriptional regulator